VALARPSSAHGSSTAQRGFTEHALDDLVE